MRARPHLMMGQQGYRDQAGWNRREGGDGTTIVRFAGSELTPFCDSGKPCPILARLTYMEQPL